MKKIVAVPVIGCCLFAPVFGMPSDTTESTNSSVRKGIVRELGREQTEDSLKSKSRRKEGQADMVSNKTEAQREFEKFLEDLEDLKSEQRTEDQTFEASTPEEKSSSDSEMSGAEIMALLKMVSAQREVRRFLKEIDSRNECGVSKEEQRYYGDVLAETLVKLSRCDWSEIVVNHKTKESLSDHIWKNHGSSFGTHQRIFKGIGEPFLSEEDLVHSLQGLVTQLMARANDFVIGRIRGAGTMFIRYQIVLEDCERSKFALKTRVGDRWPDVLTIGVFRDNNWLTSIYLNFLSEEVAQNEMSIVVRERRPYDK